MCHANTDQCNYFSDVIIQINKHLLRKVVIATVTLTAILDNSTDKVTSHALQYLT